MSKAHLMIELGGFLVWGFKPAPQAIQISDTTVVLIRKELEIPDPDLYRIYGLKAGTVELTLHFADDSPPAKVIARVAGVDVISPTVDIVGPDSLVIPTTGKYQAVLSGGKYDKVLNHTWSCGARGDTDTATVETAARAEGLVQVCCTVQIEATSPDGVRVYRSSAGSKQVMVEEDD